MSTSCPEPALVSLLGFDFTGAGICYVPQREGQACDGDWVDRNGLCLPCEPGTTCVDDICRRPCEDSGDCPCPTGAITYECEEGDLFLCNYCFLNNLPDCGDGSGAECCDGPLAECQPTALGNVCCRSAGNGCTGPDQCCPGSACYENECSTCIGVGEEYDTNHPLGCCTGLDHRQHEGAGTEDPEYCLPACRLPAPDGTWYEAGDPCSPCDSEHVYVCTDAGLDCDDGGVTYPSCDDTCDDVDDDCDGDLEPDCWTDSTICMGPVVERTGPFAGQHCIGQTFPGHHRCELNPAGTAYVPNCYADMGRPGNPGSFCGYDPGGWSHLLGDCGGYGGETCAIDATCNPYFYCSGGVSSICQVCPDDGEHCWLQGANSDGDCNTW